MASEVDICNLALGYLGDSGSVTSISPPDGSMQAGQCARFYPMARNTLLEMRHWGFASRRAALSLLSVTPPSSWSYAYALPSDMLSAIAVVDPTATDDALESGHYVPQPYKIEILSTGTKVLYTNQENAVLRYTVRYRWAEDITID